MSQCKCNRAAYYGLISSMNRCGCGCNRGCGYPCGCGWYPGYDHGNVPEISAGRQPDTEQREKTEFSNREAGASRSENVSFLYGEQLARSEPYDDGETILISDVNTTGRDIVYDPEEGVITVKRQGVYFVQWILLARNRGGEENDVVIALENPEDGCVYAKSGGVRADGARAASAAGAVAVRLEESQSLKLVNRSGASISLCRAGDAGGFSASIVMYRVG